MDDQISAGRVARYAAAGFVFAAAVVGGAIGVASAQSTTTTTPPPSTTAPAAPGPNAGTTPPQHNGNYNCPNMGGSSNTTPQSSNGANF